MTTQKKYLYDKVILLLLSVLLFLTVLITLSVIFRIGSGQGISDYYIEYRQGPSHSAQGDFTSVGNVWAIMNFLWFAAIVLLVSVVLSVKIYKIKREVSIVILGLGVLLTLLACIVSNVLLSHR
jgi:hypothetical protein